MIPIEYNLSSLKQRWAAALIAIFGIAGTVAVFVATLSLAFGLRAAIVNSGSQENAIIRRAGATAEMDSVMSLEQTRVIEDAQQVARDDTGPMASPEVVTLAVFPSIATGEDMNVQVRGVGHRVLGVRKNVGIREGRFLNFGTNEIVVGRNAKSSYSGLDVGASVKIGGTTWTVVGVFDTGGTALDSEVWCDGTLLNQSFQRPAGVSQSVTVRLADETRLDSLKNTLTTDPRMTVQVDRETTYYEKSSQQLTLLVLGIGVPVVLIMALGSVFGALNTMYTAIAERGREIATLRALGFREGHVVTSFVLESVVLATLGGVLGCVAVLPLNGLTTGTMNFQTFSHLSFAFRVTNELLFAGLAFATLMGVLGGLPPAIRAARLPVASALRDL